VQPTPAASTAHRRPVAAQEQQRVPQQQQQQRQQHSSEVQELLTPAPVVPITSKGQCQSWMDNAAPSAQQAGTTPAGGVPQTAQAKCAHSTRKSSSGTNTSATAGTPHVPSLHSMQHLPRHWPATADPARWQDYSLHGLPWHRGAGCQAGGQRRCDLHPADRCQDRKQGRDRPSRGPERVQAEQAEAASSAQASEGPGQAQANGGFEEPKPKSTIFKATAAVRARKQDTSSHSSSSSRCPVTSQQWT